MCNVFFLCLRIAEEKREWDVKVGSYRKNVFYCARHIQLRVSFLRCITSYLAKLWWGLEMGGMGKDKRKMCGVI